MTTESFQAQEHQSHSAETASFDEAVQRGREFARLTIEHTDLARLPMPNEGIGSRMTSLKSAIEKQRAERAEPEASRGVDHYGHVKGAAAKRLRDADAAELRSQYRS